MMPVRIWQLEHYLAGFVGCSCYGKPLQGHKAVLRVAAGLQVGAPSRPCRLRPGSHRDRRR